MPFLHLGDPRNAAMTAGVRAERRDSWLRRKMSRLANMIRQIFLKDGVSDSGCTLKVMRQEVCGGFIPRWFGKRRVPLAGAAQGLHSADSVPWRGLWLLIAALFVLLGTRGLNEPDEGRYAEMAREMVTGSSWLVPHLNGYEHLQKPPLIYWFTAASMKVFGCNEWAARLPSALAACGILLLTMAIARRFWNEERARVAGVILVGSLLFFGLARTLTPDMLMSFFITAAIAALVHERRWAFFIMMGLGFLTKGPMALVVPLCAAIGAGLARDRSLPRTAFPWVRGLALALVIGLSWFILLAVLDPPLFRYFWHDELVERFASNSHGRSQPFWFFVPVLIVGFLPWTFLMPGLIRQAWKGFRARKITPAQGLLLGWAVMPFIVLSLSGSKLLTYALPLIPALALATSSRFANVRKVRVIAVPAILIFFLVVGLMPWADSKLQQQASVRSLVETIQSQPDIGSAAIFSSGVRAHGFEFYLAKLVYMTEEDADIVMPTNEEQRSRLVSRGRNCAELFRTKPAYGLVRAKAFKHSYEPLGWTKLDQAGDFVLTGNAGIIAQDRKKAEGR